ncbi:MAG: hypothetical protein PHD97_08635 [Bacteroidales bacterium]|nr:hypothetical protein [Bacteroidales bacterium]
MEPEENESNSNEDLNIKKINPRIDILKQHFDFYYRRRYLTKDKVGIEGKDIGKFQQKFLLSFPKDVYDDIIKEIKKYIEFKDEKFYDDILFLINHYNQNYKNYIINKKELAQTSRRKEKTIEDKNEDKEKTKYKEYKEMDNFIEEAMRNFNEEGNSELLIKLKLKDSSKNIDVKFTYNENILDMILLLSKFYDKLTKAERKIIENIDELIKKKSSVTGVTKKDFAQKLYEYIPQKNNKVCLIGYVMGKIGFLLTENEFNNSEYYKNIYNGSYKDYLIQNVKALLEIKKTKK